MKKKIAMVVRQCWIVVSILGLLHVDLHAAEKLVVSINGEGRTLQQIIGDVAHQSGYKIEISESLLGQKVSGRYENISIEDFFVRVLKGNDVFQVFDQQKKMIKIVVTTRKSGRIMVVQSDENAVVTMDWLDSELDGESGKTNRELLKERRETFRDYTPADQELDGESGKTAQDLLDEREKMIQNHDPLTVSLDGESGKTTGDLLQERKEMLESHNPAQQPLDGELGKTVGDLLGARDKDYENYSPENLSLDGEPNKTLQNLLDERDRVYAK